MIKFVLAFIAALLLLPWVSSSRAQSSFFGCTGGGFGAPLNCYETEVESLNDASTRRSGTRLFGCSGGYRGEPLNCYEVDGAGGAMTKFIEVPPQLDEARSSGDWAKKCKPRVHVDGLGVEHVTYANKRCLYGR
jgi:hypothetical protein